MVSINEVYDLLPWKATRVKELEQELAQANRERLDWKRWLNDSEQQVKGLRKALLNISELSGMPWSDMREQLRHYVQLATTALSASTPVGEEPDVPEWVREVIHSPEFKAGVKEGMEDIKAGRTTPWSEVRKELDLPHQPETQTVCPCEVAINNLDGELCLPCWEACYGRRRHINCISCSGTLTPEETDIDQEGVQRYKKKPIMRWLGDAVDLNDMWIAFHRGAFPEDEFRQFYRDIGYSLTGFDDVWPDSLTPVEEGEKT